MPQIVVVHGVGGPNPASDWIESLNARLAGLGFPRLAPPADTIHVADFSGAFDCTVGEAPEITFTRPVGRERQRLELEYASRQRQIQHIARQHSEDRRPLGPDKIPNFMSEAGAFLADQTMPFFREVKQIVESREVLDEACRRVIDAFPRQGSVILIAHSLGSVVSARALRMVPPEVTIDLFVTIGSPLSFERYRDRASDTWKDYPYGQVKSWLNVYSPWDIVSAGNGISPAIDQAVDACARLARSHDVRGYMSHPVVAAAVGHVLFGEPRTDTSVGNVPSRRIDPAWYTPLLSTAFTYQLAEEWKSDDWKLYLRLQQARQEVARRITERIGEAQAAGAVGLAGDGPLAPGRHPTFHDLTDSGAQLLKEVSLADDGLLVLAVTLMLSPVVSPFDLEKSIDADDRRRALEYTFNVVRDHGRRNLPDARFALKITESIEWARGRLKGGGLPLGRVLIGAGITALAFTGVGLAVAAPAGLAGAAAITSTLAAFGPGGMVGGVAALSALTGTAGVLTTIGITEELTADEAGRAGAAARLGHDVLATLEPEALTSALVGMLAIAHAQSTLGFETTEPVAREAIAAALGDVSAEHHLHRKIAPKAKGTRRYGERVELLTRALDALDELDLPHVDFHVALRDAISEGSNPERVPVAPPRPEIGPAPARALERGDIHEADS